MISYSKADQLKNNKVKKVPTFGKSSKGSFGKKPTNGNFGKTPTKWNNKKTTVSTFKTSAKTELKTKVQILANRYGRLSDELSRGFGCCTCSSKMGQMDGGHFLPTSTHRPIRYYTKQIHQQCVKCNQYNDGMPVKYRLFMIERYGLPFVEKLEEQRQGDRKYSVKYYEKYLRVIGQRLERLEKRFKVENAI